MSARGLRAILSSVLLAAPAQAGQGAPPAVPAGAPGETAPAIVWCHDASRGLVSRKRAGDCDGRPVSEAEAREIRASRTRQIQNGLRPGAPLIPGRRQVGSGTGFFVSARGHVITNHHVVADCAGLSVTPAAGGPAVAIVLESDRANDLSLLAAPLVPPAFGVFRGPARPQPEEKVLVVGYPLHGMVAIKPIFVTGRVAESTLPTPAARFPLRIDIRRGNSGSPVLDRAGRVIGVISSKINTPAVYASTGQVVRDLGLAIAPAPLFDLLRNRGVEITAAPAAGALDDEVLHARARQMVAQIGCWR